MIQKKSILLFVIMLGISIDIGAQCRVSNIQLISQSDIDHFPANYPNCSILPSEVSISIADQQDGAIDIVNLDSLSVLSKIEGALVIQSNPLLENIQGLSNLHSVGDISIASSPLLGDLSGLNNLTVVTGSFQLVGSAVSNLDELSQVNAIGGNLQVDGNAFLTQVDGLSQLTLVGGYFNFYNNVLLSDCCGMLPILQVDAEDPSVISGFTNLTFNLPGCNSANEVLSDPLCSKNIPTIQGWGVISLFLLFLVIGLIGIPYSDLSHALPEQ